LKRKEGRRGVIVREERMKRSGEERITEIGVWKHTWNNATK
jgi:hypothetical protein